MKWKILIFFFHCDGEQTREREREWKRQGILVEENNCFSFPADTDDNSISEGNLNSEKGFLLHRGPLADIFHLNSIITILIYFSQQTWKEISISSGFNDPSFSSSFSLFLTSSVQDYKLARETSEK